jgi:hypothetical protein
VKIGKSNTYQNLALKTYSDDSNHQVTGDNPVTVLVRGL